MNGCHFEVIMENDLIKHVDWNAVSKKYDLTEQFIDKYSDYLNWREVFKHNDLSNEIIEKHIDKVHWLTIFNYQLISDKLYTLLCEKYPAIHGDMRIIAIVRDCGKHKRIIRIFKSEPDKISIGCFYGTQDEAIEAINISYNSREAQDYIDKVNQCFEMAKQYK